MSSFDVDFCHQFVQYYVVIVWKWKEIQGREYMYRAILLCVNDNTVDVPQFQTLVHNIRIRFLINVQVQGHHPLQWAPFQVTG